MKRVRRFLLFVALGLLAACAPVSPLDRKIDAGSEVAYNIWLNRHLDSLPPAYRPLYDQALQELRYFIMTGHAGLSAGDQRRQLLARIDGSKVRTVIAQGLLYGNARIEILLEHDRGALQRNLYLLHDTPNTPEQEQTIRGAVADITIRIARAEKEVSRNEKAIRELDPAVLNAPQSPSQTSQ